MYNNQVRVILLKVTTTATTTTTATRTTIATVDEIPT